MPPSQDGSQKKSSTWLPIVGSAIAAAAAAYWYSRRSHAPHVDSSIKPGLCKLIAKSSPTHNTRLFRFALASPDATLGLPLGRHLNARADINGVDVVRSYTPVSSAEQRGWFELLVKIYPKGAMTTYLDALNIGDSVVFSGPHGSYRHGTHNATKIGMIAGGTGITPMWQIIDGVSSQNSASTIEQPRISLISANLSDQDVLLRAELEQKAQTDKSFRAHFCVDQVLNGASWPYDTGRLSAQMCVDHLDAPAADNLILICGPPGFMKAMEQNLLSIGHAAANIIKFGWE